MTDLTPTTTGRLLLSADRPPVGEVAGVNEHQLGMILRAAEIAMRAEHVSDDLIERVIHRLVYGTPLGVVGHDVSDEQVELPPPPSAEDKIVDLIDALERSITEARAARDRRRAERRPPEDHGCG